MQILSFPKPFICTVAVICLTILTFNFSVFLQKESAGTWSGDDSYLVVSQEVYGYNAEDGLNILINEGATFTHEMVEELENMDGVKYVEKEGGELAPPPILVFIAANRPANYLLYSR
ncbi:MAG: hypothetical protein ACI4XL_07175 [Bacillus sp. (in: firmicutes)]